MNAAFLSVQKGSIAMRTGPALRGSNAYRIILTVIVLWTRAAYPSEKKERLARKMEPVIPG
jgi:hypothetical protein